MNLEEVRRKTKLMENSLKEISLRRNETYTPVKVIMQLDREGNVFAELEDIFIEKTGDGKFVAITLIPMHNASDDIMEIISPK